MLQEGEAAGPRTSRKGGRPKRVDGAVRIYSTVCMTRRGRRSADPTRAQPSNQRRRHATAVAATAACRSGNLPASDAHRASTGSVTDCSKRTGLSRRELSSTPTSPSAECSQAVAIVTPASYNACKVIRSDTQRHNCTRATSAASKQRTHIGSRQAACCPYTA